jgi:hypothetical protein
MKIDDIFRVVTGPNGAWRMAPRKPIQTRDAAFYTGKGDPLPGRSRARDMLLTTPTPTEMAAWSARMATMSGCDLGRLWVGDLTSKLDAVKSAHPAKFADAVETITDALANYGNGFASSTAVSGPSGSLAFNGTLSKVSVGDSGGAQLRKWRDQTSNKVEEMNVAAAALWAKGKHRGSS